MPRCPQPAASGPHLFFARRRLPGMRRERGPAPALRRRKDVCAAGPAWCRGSPVAKRPRTVVSAPWRREVLSSRTFYCGGAIWGGLESPNPFASRFFALTGASLLSFSGLARGPTVPHAPTCEHEQSVINELPPPRSIPLRAELAEPWVLGPSPRMTPVCAALVSSQVSPTRAAGSQADVTQNGASLLSSSPLSVRWRQRR
jgi:hypothetical protein